MHGANGLLIDQFLKDATNNRLDKYGGSAEGKSRFALEVVGAVVKAVVQKKVGFRISPWMQSNSQFPSFFLHLLVTDMAITI